MGPANLTPPGGQETSDHRQVPLTRLLGILAREWRIVLALPLATATFVVVATMLETRNYTISASFVSHSSDIRSAGAATALARQFGFDVGSDRSTQTPQFYADLVRSRSVLRYVAGIEYVLGVEDGAAQRGTLIDWLGIGATADSAEAMARTEEWLRQSLSTSVNRETGLVQVRLVISDAALGEQIVSRILEQLDRLSVRLRQARAEQEGEFIRERSRAAQTSLSAVEHLLQEFLTQNREFRNSPELAFEYERLQRQVAMQQDVYTSLLRMGEQAAIESMRDLPVVAVIDTPIGSAKPQAKGTATRGIVALLLGLALGSGIAWTRYALSWASRTGDPDYEAFRRAFGQAVHEAVRPSLWFRRSANPSSATLPAGTMNTRDARGGAA
jgi:uncharacterized protein involved in exopolysaccharide biosynthesis